MNYLDRWRAISGRIRGLAEAAQLHASFLLVRSSDSYRRQTFLSKQCAEVLLDLQHFVADNERLLPQAVLTAIRSFDREWGNLFKEAAESPDIKEERGRAILVLLAALETQVSFLLSDNQPAIRARFELAMSHLQRSIAVDEDLRSKWLTAFEEGEPACEKRGAVHLLSHGIWAFKVQAGSATLIWCSPTERRKYPPTRWDSS